MRATYRAHGGVDAYWQGRWEAIPSDEGILNLDRYPGAFANELISSLNGPVLEAGCGAGRVLRYFHDRNFDVVGIDFVPAILHKLHTNDPTTRLAAANIMHLPFPDETFAGVLAFGLYHNLESGLEDALAETRRILRQTGVICASFRADNFQNRILDKITERQMDDGNRNADGGRTKNFHKMNYRNWELDSIFINAGFTVDFIHSVENMPFLYKFSAFRATKHKNFDEQKARATGYKLSPVGLMLQKLLTAISPVDFCNTYVVLARRRESHSQST